MDSGICRAGSLDRWTQFDSSRRVQVDGLVPLDTTASSSPDLPVLRGGTLGDRTQHGPEQTRTDDHTDK